MAHNIFVACRKKEWARSHSNPKAKNIADQSKLMGKLANKIMLNLDIDKLADSVAEQIGERIMANFATSDLVDKLFQKYHDELQASIMDAIIQRL